MGALEALLLDVLGGQAQRVVKSAAAPAEPQAENKPFTVVGTTFNKHVLRSDKHVLVKFFAPWCGHCKALAPTFDKLAEQFAGHPRVSIASFDVEANEAPTA